VLSDTLSLFAVCVSMYTTGFSVSVLAIQLAEIVVFVPSIHVDLCNPRIAVPQHLAGRCYCTQYLATFSAFFRILLT
jgi:hypothetical protein